MTTKTKSEIREAEKMVTMFCGVVKVAAFLCLTVQFTNIYAVGIIAESAEI